MSQFTAGDTVTITIDGAMLQIKIEDASKSDSISAKVLTSSSSDYHEDQICDFDRNAITLSPA